MKRQLNYFNKGLDARVSETSGDETRFKKLANTRLHKRGKTGSVTRMGGYTKIYDTQDYMPEDTFIDSIFYNDYFILLWYDESHSTTKLHIIDIDGKSVEELVVDKPMHDYAEMVLLEDYIYISAYEIILNRVDEDWVINDFISTTPIISFDSKGSGGGLKQHEEYWYKARFVYYDGHITKTSFPIHISTETDTKVDLIISDIPTDLNGGYVDVEIFRKKGAGNYYLIKRVVTTGDTLSYTDSGSPNLSLLTEENYVWGSYSRTHTVVRDRLVKANNKYDGVENDTEFNVTSTGFVETGDQGIPPNTEVEIFNQVRELDGTETIFQHQGNILPSTLDKKIQLEQTKEFSRGFKEGGIYARFSPNVSDDVIRFNSLEIYNSHVPSIATAAEEIKETPINPHVFLGWRYVVKREDEPVYARIYDGEWNTNDDDDAINKNYFVTQPALLDAEGAAYNTIARPFTGTSISSNIGQSLPYTKRAHNSISPIGTTTIRTTPHANGQVTFTFNGKTIGGLIGTGSGYIADILNIINNAPTFEVTAKYESGTFTFETTQENAGKDLVFTDSGGTGLVFMSNTLTLEGISKSTVYQLGFLEALQEAVRQGRAKLRMIDTTPEVSYMSTKKETAAFINTEVKIIGIKDTSEENDQSINLTAGTLYTGKYNHLYLVLESGSVFDDFDNKLANNDGVLAKYGEASPNVAPRYKFEIIGLRGDDKMDYEITETEEWSEDIDYDYRLKLTDYTDYNNDAAIFLQRRDTQTLNTPFIPEIQGWEKKINNKFEQFVLNSWNEYATIVTDKDIKRFKEFYPNQLIWGGSFVTESNISKVRNFDFNNFKYLSDKFGEILTIKYVLGKLLAFCTNGVSLINVGEVLTRQASGQTYVDSSTLLNDDYWALENLENVQPKSIVQHENMLFFCDGYDVWMYNGQFQNITNGRIEIDPSKTYVGAYDPRNKEYLLSDNGGTYSYSLEMGEWAGKHTFMIRTTKPNNNNYYGIAENNSFTEAVEFNKGNLYGNQKFDATVESIGMYFDNPSHMKRFRKIYMDTGLMQSGQYNAFTTAFSNDFDSIISLRMSYSNDGHNFSNVQTYDKKIANGIINLGVIGGYSRGYYLYWRLETDDPDFTLYSIGYHWNLSNRR